MEHTQIWKLSQPLPRFRAHQGTTFGTGSWGSLDRQTSFSIDHPGCAVDPGFCRTLALRIWCRARLRPRSVRVVGTCWNLDAVWELPTGSNRSCDNLMTAWWMVKKWRVTVGELMVAKTWAVTPTTWWIIVDVSLHSLGVVLTYYGFSKSRWVVPCKFAGLRSRSLFPKLPG